jgi:ArsR family transcriptional regulator
MPDGAAGVGEDRPLYEIKANLFKALSHPARRRVLRCAEGAGEAVGALAPLLCPFETRPKAVSNHALSATQPGHPPVSRRHRSSNCSSVA